MRRWRSKVTAIVVAVVMVASMVGFAVPAMAAEGCESCTTCGDWVEYPLYAGQTWQVGLIRINNCLDKVGVQYVLFDSVTDAGWRLTEAHLAVAAALKDIPQTKTGNPIPGEFAYSRTYDPGVKTDQFCIDRPAGWTTGTTLYVAAHAVVNKPSTSHLETGTFCAASGADSKLADAVTAATLCWVHPLWNSSLRDAVTDLPSLLSNDAAWVWDSYENPTPRTGDLVDLYHEFMVPDGATITSAELQIASDNAFSWKLNAGAWTDVNLAGDWRNQSVFSYPTYVVDPNMTSWKKVYTYDVTSQVSQLSNALYVTGVNAAWDTDDPHTNPGGVLYKLCGAWEREVSDNNAGNDSAWGGTSQFRGKNWATYMEYTVQACCTVCCEAPFYPFQVTAHLQGKNKNGTNVLATRSNPNAILSYGPEAVDTNFFSLGFGGWIAGMYQCHVPNGAGADLVVVENTNGAYPLEQAQVWASQDGTTWFYLGMANNLGRATGDNTHTWSYFNFDDAKESDAADALSTPLDWVQYVKVVDASNPALHATTSDGFDLNTIRALQDGVICQ